jgi:Ca-activated chloride channel homolog
LNAYRFEDPLILALLLLLVPLVWWLRRPQRRATLRISSLASLQGMTPSWRIRFRPVLLVLRVLAIALMVVALARPQRGEANGIAENSGIDIVIAQDLSGSMSSPFGPQSGKVVTRLSASKQLAAQFVKERKNDRIGIVVFESETQVLSPLTDDHQALLQIINKWQNGIDGLPDGTAIGQGLASALNVLRTSQARSHVIVLLTDGEENVHEVEPEEAAKLAKVLGVRVYTVGIIDPTMPEVDVQTLKDIADPTGGAYFPASSPSALANVYQRINQLEKSDTQRQHFFRYDELAPWFMLPALGLLLLEVSLANTVFRRTP